MSRIKMTHTGSNGYILLIYFISIAFIVSQLFCTVELSFLLVLITFAICICMLGRNYEKNIWAFCFLISFFTFLLGNIGVNLIFGRGIQLEFPIETLQHIAATLEVSIVFFSLGYCFFSRKNIAVDLTIRNDSDSILKLQNVCKVFFYITLPFVIMVSIEKAFFVAANSYTSYYVDFSSSLPSIINNLNKVNEVAFYVLLASLPRKKLAMPVIFINLAVSTLSLSFGQRNGFMLALIITIGYLLWRNSFHPNGEKWINQKSITALMVVAPALISMMYAFNTYREGMQASVDGIFNRFFAFFEEMGGSVNVIGYGYEYRENFNPDVSYTLSQITKIVTDNSIFSSIFGKVIYTGQTVENALYGNNYGGTLTYLVMPYNYLAGIGMGSSYVAETFHDFGYVGIILVNLFYGFIFAKINGRIEKDPYWGGIILLMIKDIIYAPRYPAFYFVTDALSLTVIISLLTIKIFSKFNIRIKHQG